MTKPDQKQKQRRGPKPLDPADLRDHCVSVRLNLAELEWLDRVRAPAKMQRGEYLRAAAKGKLPTTIPPINVEAWAELARSAANLNQIAKHLNSGDRIAITQIMSALQDFRRDIIGAKDDES
jgi:hypothetical protein